MSSIDLEWRNYLLHRGIIEGQSEAKKRDDILTILRSLIPSFVRLSVKENNTKPSDFECQLLPFGSFALGGHLYDGDIDVVLLAPHSVRRRDFSTFFTKLLKNQPIIREVECIPRANVPIIKCVIDSIPIDISFVRLHMTSVPAGIDLLDDSHIRGLEGSCLASTDGPRVGQFILTHIHPHDLPAFRLALQSIKYWANKRYLYGKPMGYLNGGSWTLLLLKVYFIQQAQSSSSSSSSSSSFSAAAAPATTKRNASLKYHTQIPSTRQSHSSHDKSSPSPTTPSTSPTSISPTASTSSITPTPTRATPLFSDDQKISCISLLKLFFRTWSTWSWPNAVIVNKHMLTITSQTTNDTNTSNDMDCLKSSLLPIATPCDPVTSAAPFVTQSTLSVLTNEMQRAHNILQSEITDTTQTIMDKLFKPLHIVKAYKHFIKVTVSCQTIGSHEIWSRRMPTYLPRLVGLLEVVREVKLARPLTKSYTDIVSYRTRYEKERLKNGLQVNDSDTHGSLLPGTLYRRCFLIGLDFDDYHKKGNTVVDVSDAIKSFYKEIQAKKCSRDSDVHVYISAIKRREAASLIQN
ncbi:hypothetical protein BCR42DRAFT_375299 [Absidia repens]|uniref:polynucleotide adenylyltransferase n=1 Tax=Absidia repens TaxID=90262 RepID=A0A1X2IHT1_9FUNG|nr:hypothetical protein BCR42DRAFT_375299 [Absidia repens]